MDAHHIPDREYGRFRFDVFRDSGFEQIHLLSPPHAFL
jgi:hypothetical protein